MSESGAVSGLKQPLIIRSNLTILTDLLSLVNNSHSAVNFEISNSNT